ncbi:DUF4231 domain-containing protein [Micromonospora coxensis]|uniref:DUF4231 domain-containing protein n=1 Tax=Micromonospora coxensis TaxID=356852 RepID=UPI00344AF0D3
MREDEYMPNANELQALQDRALERWEYLQSNWRRRARVNKGTSVLLVYLSVSLAISATVLATAPAIPKWLVAAVSGGTALATTLLAATKAQEHWALARSIQNQLHAERFLYEQQAGPYALANASTDEARTRLFSERITEIALAAHDSWATRIVTTPTPVAAAPASSSPVT